MCAGEDPDQYRGNTFTLRETGNDFFRCYPPNLSHLCLRLYYFPSSVLRPHTHQGMRRPSEVLLDSVY